MKENYAACAPPSSFIFPQPQRAVWGRGVFRLPRAPRIAFLGINEPDAALREFTRATGLGARPCAAGGDFVLAVGEPAWRLLREQGFAFPSRCRVADGYALEITSRQVILAAADTRGLFYAEQSLAQVIAAAGQEARRLPCLSVRDWPRFPVRGVHVYLPARRDIPFFKRFIAFLGRYKFNTMFLEIGGGLQYDRHPEINAGWERLAREAAAFAASQSRMQNSAPGHKDSIHIELGGGSYLTKAEARDIAACCREHHIEIIPEVQSLSHSYYLLTNHRELAENPADRWPDTYCPSNPKTYELLFDVMDEVIEVFQPRTISIGHDEVYTIALCPRCRGQAPGELFARDVQRIHDYLAARGIRTAMWSEKLHHKPGPCQERWRFRRFGREFRGALPDTTRALDLVPKDILLLNWYVTVDPQSVRLLRERGFEQVIGNYGFRFFLENVQQRNGLSLEELVTRDSRGRKVRPGASPSVLGAEVSTWCAPRPENFSPYNFLINQASLWTAELTPRSFAQANAVIAPIHRREARILAGMKSILCAPGSKHFRPISIEAVADVICDGVGRMWGGFASMDLRNIPAGAVRLSGVPFRIIDYPRTRQCPFVGVDANVRNSFPIDVGLRARALVFLHTSSVRVRNLTPWTRLHLGDPVIAAYMVAYADGKEVEVPIIHGVNIGRVDDASGTPPVYGDVAWRGRDAAGRPITLYTTEWVNPRPRVPIASLMLLWRGGYLEGDVILAAITAIVP